MKVLLALLLLASGCVGMSERFVKLDDRFEVQSHSELAQLVVNDEEMSQLPPLRFVGVMEVKGKETERLSTFVERVTKAGAEFGCDAVVQRDAFQDGDRVQRHGMVRTFYRNDLAVWQFLCGVRGATEEEQERTMKEAIKLAVNMRADELGSYEPCAAFTPTGSHVRKTRVCTDDPGHRSQPDAANSDR